MSKEAMVLSRSSSDAPPAVQEWLHLALSAPVRRRALRYVLIVGAILITINHGDALLHGDVSTGRLIRIGLTLLVPYLVSTFSSVAAMLEAQRPKGE